MESEDAEEVSPGMYLSLQTVDVHLCALMNFGCLCLSMCILHLSIFLLPGSALRGVVLSIATHIFVYFRFHPLINPHRSTQTLSNITLLPVLAIVPLLFLVCLELESAGVHESFPDAFKLPRTINRLICLFSLAYVAMHRTVFPHSQFDTGSLVCLLAIGAILAAHPDLSSLDPSRHPLSDTFDLQTFGSRLTRIFTFACLYQTSVLCILSTEVPFLPSEAVIVAARALSNSVWTLVAPYPIAIAVVALLQGVLMICRRFGMFKILDRLAERTERKISEHARSDTENPREGLPLIESRGFDDIPRHTTTINGSPIVFTFKAFKGDIESALKHARFEKVHRSPRPE